MKTTRFPKGSSSGPSTIISSFCDENSSSITASIKGLALSFSANNDNMFENYTGTVTDINSDGE